MILLDSTKTEYMRLKSEINEDIIDVLESGKYTGGDKTIEFEHSFAEYLNVKYAVSCANGIDALVLALRAAGVGRGDEVITTPWGPANILEAIIKVEAVPVFADIDKNTCNIDPACIEEKITGASKAILCVHMFGQPCDMKSIKELADKYKLYVIEDASQAIGAEYNGRKTGSIGDMACFSFSEDSNLCCCGSGGMVTTNNGRLAAVLSDLKGGKSRWKGKQAVRYINKNMKERDITDKKINIDINYVNCSSEYTSKLDELQAAILLIKLRYLDGWNEKRIRTAEYYSRELAGWGMTTDVNNKKTRNIYCKYVLNSERRDEYILYLNSMGIEAKVCYPLPLHLQRLSKDFGWRKGDFPIAELRAKTSFQIPVNGELTPYQKEYIVKAIRGFYEEPQVINITI